MRNGKAASSPVRAGAANLTTTNENYSTLSYEPPKTVDQLMNNLLNYRTGRELPQ